MKSPFQRRTALVAVILAPALAACGFSAQTDQVYQAAQGVNDRSGDVDILNAIVVAGADGSGTFAGSLVNKTGNAQQLTGITGTGVTAMSANAAGVTVAAYKLVNLALPAAGTTDAPQIALTGTSVKIGAFIRLTLTFASGQSTTVYAPVVSTDSQDGSEYANVPLPAASTKAP